MYYVYLLQSKTRIYIGITGDLNKRVCQHNSGQNVSTKAYTPWTLIFYEAYIDQEDASRREKYLKTTQGRQAIRRMLKAHFYKQSLKHFDYQGSTTR